MENLKALVYKGDPTPYQRALAQREFEGMLERLEIYENAVKNNAANRVLYCVKVQANHDCWISDWDGDPGRTLVKENAKTFERMSDARKLCKEMRAKYPNRNVWVDVF